MKVQHNMMAVNANRQLKISTNTTSGCQEKLISGYRINRSADDAAGLSISEKMRRQIRGLNQTLANIQDGISLIQTADGALTETHAILQRMNELAVKSANGTNSSSDRKTIQEEVDGLISEIDRIAYATEIFDIKPLLGDTTVVKTSYSMPENTIHTLKDAAVIDGQGTIRFMAEGLSCPLAGVWDTQNSKPSISVRDANGNSTGTVNLTNNAFITYAAPSQDQFISTYNDNKISFQLELTWKKIDCSTEDTSREYFEFAYNFINTSASELTFDFWFQMDMLVGPRSDAIPCLDGKQTENTYKWINAIPEEMTIDDFVNIAGSNTAVNLSAQYTWKGIQNAPDIVMSGHQHDIGMASAMNPALSGDLGITYPYKDYFYGVGWRQKSISAGSQFVMQNRIGLYAQKKPEHSYHVYNGNPPVWIQTGCDAGVGMMIGLCNATAENLGVDDFNVSTEDLSRKSINIIASAIDKVSAFRSRFGAQQNRLEHAMRINDNTMENTQAAESIIRDTNMTEMISKYILADIVRQAGQSILAQANFSASQVLQLLK